jgi:hypothetical protein
MTSQVSTQCHGAVRPRVPACRLPGRAKGHEIAYLMPAS